MVEHCGHRHPVAVRRATESEAAVVWHQLARGDWSVLDRFDDGSGRRYLFALYEGPTVPRPWHKLSRRERTIVAAVAKGHSNRQIAGALGISVSTVAGHLRMACKKLGGARRIELVREWTSTLGGGSGAVP